jgi:hypothetical protein
LLLWICFWWQSWFMMDRSAYLNCFLEFNHFYQFCTNFLWKKLKEAKTLNYWRKKFCIIDTKLLASKFIFICIIFVQRCEISCIKSNLSILIQKYFASLKQKVLHHWSEAFLKFFIVEDFRVFRFFCIFEDFLDLKTFLMCHWSEIFASLKILNILGQFYAN